MPQDIKFIVLNRDEQFATELRETLLAFDRVKIVAEVDDPALLASAVTQFPVDVVLVNLDPNPEATLPLIADIASNHKNLIFFAVSESTDGPLILKAMRLGVKEFFPLPLERASVGEAIQKLSAGRAETKPSGKLVTVVGASGGVGATTIAANLAAELAGLANGKVTAVDLDYRFGQVATLLDITPTYTLADLCGSPEALEPSVIGRALTQHACGVRVLARPNNFAEADLITGASCMGVVSNLLEMNDYVVTDGPTRFDVGATSVLSLSDVNLLVVHLIVPSVRSALRILENMRSNGFNLDRTKLICNRVGREEGHLTPENVGETLGLGVFATIPHDWQTVSAAANLGEPLLSLGPKTKVRLAIQEIAQRLHNPDAETDDKDTRKKGLIGRIFANT
jgi:pilus assembly protein CpaE